MIFINSIPKPKSGPNLNLKAWKKYPGSILSALPFFKRKASKPFTLLEDTMKKRPKCPTQFTNSSHPKTKSLLSSKITPKNKVNFS
jgi:hypothetical protein